jgi:hypothetical protein
MVHRCQQQAISYTLKTAYTCCPITINQEFANFTVFVPSAQAAPKNCFIIDQHCAPTDL